MDSAGATGPRVKVIGSKAKPPGKENEPQVGSDWLHTRKGRGETRTQFFSLGPYSFAFNKYIALSVGWTEEANLEKDLGSKGAPCPDDLFFLLSSG